MSKTSEKLDAVAAALDAMSERLGAIEHRLDAQVVTANMGPACQARPQHANAEMSERDPLGGWYAGPHGQHYREVEALRLVAAYNGEWGVTVWVDGRRRFADCGRADDMAGAKDAAESWVRDFAAGLLRDIEC